MDAWIEETVSAFGRSMGLDGLTFNDRGVICLEIEDTGLLYIERPERDGDIVVYLARKMPPGPAGWAKKALSLPHHKNMMPRKVCCGLKGSDVLVFLTRIRPREFVQSELEQAVALLTRLHDEVMK